MTVSSLDAVLFDFAGTLLMPRSAAEFVASAARAQGLDLTFEDCQRLGEACITAGFPGGPYPAVVPEHLAQLYERRDLSTESHRAAYVGLLSTVPFPHPDMAIAIYDQIREPASWLPYADTINVVERVRRRGVKVGVVSNVGFDIRPILHAHGLAEPAGHCTLSFEIGTAKPDPRIFEAALRELQADPGRALMVGDHEEVDRGGEGLGIRTVILPMTAPGGQHGLARILELL